jgi:Flp pilus assembly pilin Flp
MRARVLKSESGQTSVEWLALCAFIVAVVAVVATLAPDIAHTIADAITNIIKKVTSIG